MTGRHARRRLTPAWTPTDEDGGEDFPVTAEDAARFAALAEEYRQLWAAADDPVMQRRLARAAQSYRRWAARGEDRRTNHG